MKDYSGVWVYAEHDGNAISRSTLEIMGKGRELASRLGVELSVVLFGYGVSDLVETLIEYGADNVYVSDDERLKYYKTLNYAKLLTELIRRHRPEIVLFAASYKGRDLAPRVAASLRTGLTANCIDLDIGDFEDREKGERFEKILYQIVPAYGGNVVATIITPYHRPQIATVRPGNFQVPEKFPGKGKVFQINFGSEDWDDDVEVLEVERDEEDSKLEKARVIVGVGVGARGSEGVKILKRLAEALGGTLGATRPVVDAGLLPHECMIGETGKVVRPELYLACGISGAAHHMIGVRGAKVIIAINKDPKSPICEAADYIVIGDIFEVVPKLLEKLGKHGDAL
ncbi:MAG: electron transfer flavoprotein subunit alpha/FixB family protein [Crenarchaeota archaeon]|nr:electron transfer flavoprotein subunit alpha/FixB family protein [Thermoproteota archaeon]